jgi:aspartate dehydrogenase
MRGPVRLAFIGWGAISRHCAHLLAEESGAAKIVAVGVRDKTRLQSDLPAEARILIDPGELRTCELELVVEAADRSAVEPWGRVALQHAKAYLVTSTSAFCEPGVLEGLRAVADANASHILIPPGALGGIDALGAAARVPLGDVLHTIVKPPEAWRGTAAETVVDLAGLKHAKVFFSGTAREAARRFPQNANAAAITALAGVGLDRTRVVLVADPAAKGNGHRLAARGDFGVLNIDIENHPLPDNPKSSQLTALNIVRVINNLTRSVVFV